MVLIHLLWFLIDFDWFWLIFDWFLMWGYSPYYRLGSLRSTHLSRSNIVNPSTYPLLREYIHVLHIYIYRCRCRYIYTCAGAMSLTLPAQLSPKQMHALSNRALRNVACFPLPPTTSVLSGGTCKKLQPSQHEVIHESMNEFIHCIINHVIYEIVK